MAYKFSDEKFALPTDKSTSSGVIKTKNIRNQKLTKELLNPIIKDLENFKYIHHLKTIFVVLI